MSTTTTIDSLARSTLKRAIRESLIGVVLMGYFAYNLQFVASGTPRFYGSLLIIASTGFALGVIWSYVIGAHTLRIHPASDKIFWREAFLAQSKLLKAVPLWYLAPILTGVIIFALPTNGISYSEFLTMLATCGIISATTTWLNRKASAKLEEQAQSFAQ